LTFKDLFSGHAADYAAFRPRYPSALFAHLAAAAPDRTLAWDCATGNGQAALALTPHFRSVVATDASERQIAQARPHEKITYLVAPAERTPLPDATVELVTVAQALHWLDLPSFYAEVKRVVRPGGVIAVWCYQLHTIGPEVDAIVHHLYSGILGDYWPPERRLVEEGYRTLSFPFAEMTPPPFEMVQSWDLARLLSYLGTWSSSQRYRAQVGTDPIDLIRADMEAAWGGPSQVREVVWPLHLRVGIISGTKP
jgi:ubiquinone/menaquinone biosynthesis C-methylase UbiE